MSTDREDVSHDSLTPEEITTTGAPPTPVIITFNVTMMEIQYCPFERHRLHSRITACCLCEAE